MKIAVIGRGVVGLGTALALSDRGHSVYVCDAESRKKTSLAAAAFWYPFAVETSEQEERELALPTLNFYRENQETNAERGVGFINAKQFFDASVSEVQRTPPWWMREADTLVRFKPIAKSKLPRLGNKFGSIVEGWQFKIPVIDPPPFLDWLETQLRQKNVEFEKHLVDRIDDLANNFDLIVNCSGIWATHLTSDPYLHGKQGVVIAAPRQFTGDKLNFLEHGTCAQMPVYIVPHTNFSILGGTLEQINANGEKLTSDHAWRARIEVVSQVLERCRFVDRKLAAWNPSNDDLIACSRVAPRPVRDGMPPRIELDNRYRVPVIHNYGHGGSGFTMFWGSALKVCEIVEQQCLVQRQHELRPSTKA